MRYVGLDAHWRQSTICVLDHRGQKLLSQTIKGTWSKVLEEGARCGSRSRSVSRRRPATATCTSVSRRSPGAWSSPIPASSG